MRIVRYAITLFIVIYDVAPTRAGWDCAIDAPCVCENNVINCKQRGLTAVPKITPSQDQYDQLTLANNKITKLGDMAFKGLKVKKLDLSGNPITSISNSSFRGLASSLRELRMEVTAIRNIPTSAINELTLLETLVLMGFNVGTLPSFVFTSSALSDVSLINCGISKLSTNSFDGIKSSLKSLTLNGNRQLNNVPTEALSKLTSLKKLNLVQTGLKHLREDAFRGLNSLQDVDLSHNEITRISEKAFLSVKNSVQVLLLHINGITGGEQLRPLGELINLHQLNLAYNQITTIPTGLFQKMRNLAFLNLYDNKLSSLSRDTLDGLQHTLHTLLLGENGIKEIETDTFLHFTELSELHMDVMDLSGALYSKVFRGLESKLSALYLDKTRVTDTVWSAVDRLHKLEVLVLENNVLTKIPDNALQFMTSLRTLNVGGNIIHSLSQRSLHGPENSLRTLNLHNNPIRTLDKCTIFGFKNLREMSLSGIALQCDCRLKWVKGWVADKYEPFLASRLPWRCGSPPKLSGKLFGKIAESELVCDDPSVTESTCAATEPPVTVTTSVNSVSSTQPSGVVLIRTLTSGPHAMKIKWTIPKSLLISLTGIIVEYRKAKGSSLQRTQPIHASLDQYTIQNLTSSTTYLVCLTLIKIDGSQVSHSDYCIEGNTTLGREPEKIGGGEKADKGNVGIILGAVLGVIAVIVCIVIVAFLIIKKKKKSTTYDKPDTGNAFPSREDMPQFGYGSKRFTKTKSRTSADLDNCATGTDPLNNLPLHFNKAGDTISGFTNEERDKILNLLTNSGSSQRYVPELPPRNPKPSAQDDVDNPEDHVYMEINYI